MTYKKTIILGKISQWMKITLKYPWLKIVIILERKKVNGKMAKTGPKLSLSNNTNVFKRH